MTERRGKEKGRRAVNTAERRKLEGRASQYVVRKDPPRKEQVSVHQVRGGLVSKEEVL